MQTVARTLGMLVLLSASANAQTQPIQQAPQAQPASPQPQPSSQQPAVQSTPKLKEILVRPGNIPGVAPEHQEAARKSREAREKVAICQKEASDQKILPRYRTQFVLDCIDRKTN